MFPRSRLSKIGVIVLLLVGITGLAVAKHSATTSPFLRLVMVDQVPNAIVVDTHTRKAFVTMIDSDPAKPGSVGIFDTETGAPLHNSITGNSMIRFPAAEAVDWRTGRVLVVVNGDSSVHTIDARDGHLLNIVPVGHTPASVVVSMQTGRVFVVRYAGTVSTKLDVLNSSSGGVRRTLTVPGQAMRMAVDEVANHVFVASWSPVGLNGSVSMLDARTGLIVRTVAVGRMPGALAIDERTGRVFVVNRQSNSVSVLDARTGSVLRTTLVGRASLAVTVDDRISRAFILSSTGSMAVLDTMSGRVLQTLSIGQRASAMAMDARHARVIIAHTALLDNKGHATGNGWVSELDAVTGRVLRVVPVQGDPRAIAVDEGTGHVIVGSKVTREQLIAPSWVPSWLQGLLPQSSTKPVQGSVSILPIGAS